MYQKLIKKIKKSEPIDWNGIFFIKLDLFRKNINILFSNWYIYFVCYTKKVKLGKGIIFHGVPIIRRFPNSSIIFGSECKFNSARNSLTIGLPQPCAFVTGDKNAEILIGNNTGVSGLRIHAISKVTIGNNVLIGSNCTILDNDSHHSDFTKRKLNIIPSCPVCIEDNVFIGMECTILKGVTIGKNSVIGARSVVFNDIPENSIAIGNPCKVIMKKNVP